MNHDPLLTQTMEKEDEEVVETFEFDGPKLKFDHDFSTGGPCSPPNYTYQFLASPSSHGRDIQHQRTSERMNDTSRVSSPVNLDGLYSAETSSGDLRCILSPRTTDVMSPPPMSPLPMSPESMTSSQDLDNNRDQDGQISEDEDEDPNAMIEDESRDADDGIPEQRLRQETGEDDDQDLVFATEEPNDLTHSNSTHTIIEVVDEVIEGVEVDVEEIDTSEHEAVAQFSSQTTQVSAQLASDQTHTIHIPEIIIPIQQPKKKKFRHILPKPRVDEQTQKEGLMNTLMSAVESVGSVVGSVGSAVGHLYGKVTRVWTGEGPTPSLDKDAIDTDTQTQPPFKDEKESARKRQKCEAAKRSKEKKKNAIVSNKKLSESLTAQGNKYLDELNKLGIDNPYPDLILKPIHNDFQSRKHKGGPLQARAKSQKEKRERLQVQVKEAKERKKRRDEIAAENVQMTIDYWQELIPRLIELIRDHRLKSNLETAKESSENVSQNV